jgi:hypothetical protein
MESQPDPSSLTRLHRIYFGAVAFLAFYVGIWGYFIPLGSDEALPWLVPPLHARFLGAMYFSGMTLMIGCILARRWSTIRVVVPMISIWTGMLFIVSLFYLPEFDFRREQSWIWFAAYLIYPIIAAWLAWQKRGLPDDLSGLALPAAARAFLTGQGIVLTVLALALLFFPVPMVGVWPWAITPLLAQIYSAPFLSYGVGSLLHARRHSWAQVQVAVIGFAVFAALILIASLIHRGLFSAADLSDWLWFAAFIVILLGNGALTVMSFLKGEKAPAG